MGCGASTAAKAEVPQQALSISKQGSRVRNSQSAQLKKINSKLGERAVVNSFVVQKSRSRRHPSQELEAGQEQEEVRKKATEREALPEVQEAPVNAGEADSKFHLPAEAVAVADPTSLGVSQSGPSFKIKRVSHVEDEQRPSLLPAASLSGVKAKLSSPDDAEVMQAVTQLREQLSSLTPPQDGLRDSGVVAPLVALLQRDAHRCLQYQVAWTLTNMCSADPDDCVEVVRQGAVPHLVSLLGSCDDHQLLLQQVVWALGNIAADSKELQLAVLEQQCVTPLLAAMARNSESLPVLRQAAWLLSNLTRPRPQSKELHDAIPTLTAILTTPDMDTEVLTHSCWALAYLSSEEEAVRELADPEVALPLLRNLAQWVAQPQQPTTAPALRIIGNMCSGSTALTQVVVDGGAIPALLACLTDSNRLSLKKEAIWTLSNIAAGTCPQVAALLASGAYPRVMACLRGAEASLKRECCYVLANPWADTVGLSQTVAEQLVEAGVVQELVSLLQPGQPLPLLLVAMEGLQDAIKRGQKLMMAAAKERAARAREAELAREEAEGAQAADPGPQPGPAGADGASGSGAPPPPPAGPDESEPAVLRNSVAQAMKGCGVMLRLEELLHHQDSAVHAKSNALRNILEFM